MIFAVGTNVLGYTNKKVDNAVKSALAMENIISKIHSKRVLLAKNY